MFDGLNDINLVSQRYCDNCGRPFEIDRPAEAPHKRFCSVKCRNEHHYNKAKAKRAAEREARAQSAAWNAWTQARGKQA